MTLAKKSEVKIGVLLALDTQNEFVDVNDFLLKKNSHFIGIILR